MIDISKLKFGDIIYQVVEQNNSFFRKKVHMTDAQGQLWFRYDRPNYTYSINELVYCGKVIHVVSGDVSEDGVYETEYHYKHKDGTIDYKYEGEILELTEWFTTREEAQIYIDIVSERKNDI